MNDETKTPVVELTEEEVTLKDEDLKEFEEVSINEAVKMFLQTCGHKFLELQEMFNVEIPSASGVLTTVDGREMKIDFLISDEAITLQSSKENKMTTASKKPVKKASKKAAKKVTKKVTKKAAKKK